MKTLKSTGTYPCTLWCLLIISVIALQFLLTGCKEIGDTNNGWRVVREVDLQTNLIDLCYQSDSNIWACGWNGVVVHSTDGGRTWTAKNIPAKIELSGVSFVDDKIGWVVGERGKILSTTDGGQTWKYQNSRTEKYLRDVRFINPKEGWAVGEGGLILHTPDGGQTWTPQNSGTNVPLNEVFFLDDHEGWIACGSGIILHTSDKGKHWELQDSSITPPVYTVFFVDSQYGWAAGGYSYISITHDGGRTWQLMGSNIPDVDTAQPQKNQHRPHLKGIHFINRNEGWIIGEMGTVLHTTDGGTTWEWQHVPTASHLRKIHFDSNGRGLIVGWDGVVLSTGDGGKSWSMDSNMEECVDYNSICFSNAETGWIVGESSRITHSIDEGKSWHVQQTPSILDLREVFFIDDREGWASGAIGTVIHTIDGGRTWEIQVTSSSYTLESIFFINRYHGWAVGKLGAMLYTMDGGVTWEQRPEVTFNDLYDIFFVDDEHGWAVGQFGTILYTENRGTMWELQKSNTPMDLYDVHFLNPSVGWAVGKEGTVITTQDGGKTWTERDVGTQRDLHSVYFMDDKNGWITGDDGTILRTKDAGVTWRFEMSGTKSDLYKITSSGSNLWVVGKWGTVLSLDTHLPPAKRREIQEVHLAQKDAVPIVPVKETEENPDPYGEMVFVPAGEFIMGGDGDFAFIDSRPAHKRYVDSFWIDKYEVTNAAYQKFVDATGHKPPPTWKDGRYPPGKSNWPVVDVVWYDAVAYAKWAGKRLPTEAEWEKAARGTDGRLYPWGNNLLDIDMPSCAFGIIGSKPTIRKDIDLQVPGPVGRIPAAVSPYGCLDMSGNAWEWVQDWFDRYPENTYQSEWYGKKYKVARGGSNGPADASTYVIYRYINKPDQGYYCLGFRCAADKPPEEQETN